MVPSIIDVWGYDREFCSSSSYKISLLYVVWFLSYAMIESFVHLLLLLLRI